MFAQQKTTTQFKRNVNLMVKRIYDISISLKQSMKNT